ncbi:MAG: TonB-dependent receptor plug domain-containing protein [Prevotella sp.]
MMKRTVITIIIAMAQVCLMAQMAKDVDLCLKAEEAYRIGRFDEAVELLEANLDGFSERTRETAYRLLTLCYMEKDQSDIAKRYANLLLKENPYYTVSLTDPIRFADMIETMKSGKGATIITASQQAESIEEAPVPVTLITEDMIKASGAKTLSDLLVMFVPGMTKVEGLESNVAMHGVYSSTQEKILVMLDGHRLNSRTTNSEQPDFRTSLEKIKQIEVLRGPASSLYGNVALTAVVNIITKTGGDVDGIKFSTGIGNDNTYLADFLMGKSYYGIDFLAWASVYSSEGEKREVNPGDKEHYGMVPTSGYMYLEGYNHKPSYDIGIMAKWNNFSFLFNTQSSKRVIAYSNLVHLAPYSYEKYRKINGATPGHSRESTHLELSYEKSWQKWSAKIQAYVDMESCSNYDVCGDTILPEGRIMPVGPGEIIEFGPAPEGTCEYGLYQVQAWNDYTYGGIFQSSYSFNHKELKGSLLFGAQFENYTMKDNTMICGDNFERVLITFSDANKSILTGSEWYLSPFAQLKLSLNERLIFNGGIRYDFKRRYNDRNLKELSPRLSLVYRISPNSSMKLGYAHSFVDAPYFYRATTIQTYAGGNKLEAEKMDAVQLSYSHDFKSLSMKYDCNVYYNALSDNIYFNPNTTGDILSNAGSLKVLGIENVISYNRNRWYAQMNFSYQRVLDSENYIVTDSHINGVPDFKFNALARYRFLEKKDLTMSVKGNMLYQTMQYAPLTSSLIFVNGTGHSDPLNKLSAYAVLNAGLDCEYKKLRGTLDFYNILNNDYLQGGSFIVPIPQQKFNFVFKLTYTI